MGKRVPLSASGVSSAENLPAIRLRGVRVHNLKNIDLDLPRGQMIAICGVSGSGKTSLALDTLYAEGQRRYIESFSAYTRQFLERLEKPDFDTIEGLPPALAVTRTGTPRGNRSTVGTASETLDYLRLLFANISQLICYQCGRNVESHTPQSAAAVIEKIPRGKKMMIGFSVEWEDIGDRSSVLAELQNQGFVRLIAGGRLLNLGQDEREQFAKALPAAGKVWVVVDRVRGGDSPTRTTESLESAFAHGYGSIVLFQDGSDTTGEPSPHEIAWQDQGLASVAIQIDEQPWLLATLTKQHICATCSIEYPSPEPRLFSFNSPLGACPKCEGFGDTIDLDMDLVVPDRKKSIEEGAIAPWNSPAYEHHLDELLDVAEELGVPTDVPFSKLGKRQQGILIEGDTKQGYRGIKGFFTGLERKKYKMHVRVFISRYRSYNRCSDCNGSRLSDSALSYRIAGTVSQAESSKTDKGGIETRESIAQKNIAQKNMAQLCEMRIDELSQFLNALELSDRNREIARRPLQQVISRLGYLCSVGLGYLQLSRTLRTLSGGEAQRTALSAALGSNLVNMLYVLDEPSVGLHPHDVHRLAEAIELLMDRDNTVVIVEHEEVLLRRVQTLVEVGPRAGSQGGEIVFCGSHEQMKQGVCLTGDYLSGHRHVPVPQERRRSKIAIELQGCSGNNLKSLDVSFPLGVLCVVTGVSGSGKSSLVQDTLHGALTNRLSNSRVETLPYDKITGVGQIDDCILVDQSPVSRSPRSNPVTFVKAFDEVRNAFAETLTAKTRNLTAGHFSFNSDLGRCPLCKGDGVQQIDMQFLADVQMTCTACDGARYRKEILSVRYRDQSISDVLNMTVREARDFFRGTPKVQQKLKVLVDVGLDYLQLGQSAMTLSAGEAQRLKLAGFLANSSKKRTLFLLDEPTTGLHSHDIVQLLTCFDALLADGNSLIVVEHNVHLMAAADHIIDLGPGAASEGGSVVVAGTPEEVALCKESRTAKFLSDTLAAARR